MTITKEQKTKAITDFQSSEKGYCSSAVQIAVLTPRINHLTEHMRGNTKDYASRPRSVANG